MAASLWLGPSAAISHASAAALWQFPGFPPGPVELSVEKAKRTGRPIVIHKVKEPLARVVTKVGPLPVTNAGHTILDIAGKVAGDVIEETVEDAVRRGLTSVSHLRWLAQSRRGRSATGIASLRSVLDEVGSQTRVSESRFETRLFLVLRRSALPPPKNQFEVRDNGKLVARVDFAYPEAKVALEADSYRFHSGRQAWERDIDRRGELTALGWKVLNVTWRQLEQDPKGVVERVKKALGSGLF
jgi:very-short-patch-repair endonuclease